MSRTGLSDLLERSVPAADGPGAVIGLVACGELAAVAARGIAELDTGVPLSAQTVFPLASVSKQFTAYGVALLAESGVLRLDDPVHKYLPWLPFDDFTVSDAIHHTTGLRDQWGLIGLSGRLLTDISTMPSLVDLIAAQRERNFVPGVRQLYSNSGYTLLALLVESVTGEPMDRWYRTHVFDPVGMTDSAFLPDVRATCRGRAQSYSADGQGHWRHVPLSHSHVGSTGVFATVGDLATWAKHAMAPEQSERLQASSTLTDGTSVPYGLGLGLADRYGTRVMWHSGGHAGFRTHLAMAPAPGIAAIVLANTPGVDTAALADEILAAGIAPGSTSDPVTGNDVARGPGRAPCAGLYLEDGSELPYQIWWTASGQLALRRASVDQSSPADELISSADGTFRSRDGGLLLDCRTTNPRLQFTAHSWTTLRRVEPASEPPVAARTGAYYSPELDSLLHVEKDSDGLWIRRPMWGRKQLAFYAPDRFEICVPESELQAPITGSLGEDAVYLSTTRAHRVRFARVEVSR